MTAVSRRKVEEQIRVLAAKSNDQRMFFVFDASQSVSSIEDHFWICESPYVGRDGRLRTVFLAKYRPIPVDRRLLRMGTLVLLVGTSAVSGFRPTLRELLDYPDKEAPGA